MSAGIYNFNCDIGCTFNEQLTYEDNTGTPIDLTGYTAQMDVKSSTVILSLTTSNSRISLGGALGTITLTVSATDTAALTPGFYLYDLILTSAGGQVSRIIEGSFTVVRGVSLG